MSTTDTMPDIGKIITAYFQEKRIRKSALARLLKKNIKTVLNYQTSTSMQTKVLWELSHALKHNFFVEYSSLLPETFTSSIPINPDKDLRIAELEQQIKILEAEKAVLVSVMKG